MPAKVRRENTFIKLFLSAYEGHSWADAKVEWLDEKIDGAVEALATRKSDGKTLAIEHTIIQPFVGEKEDFAFFEDSFLKIEKDTALIVPERWIQVFVPVGTLHGQRKWSARDAIVKAVHFWIKTNLSSLPEGRSKHSFPITIPRKGTLDMKLFVRVVQMPGPGKLHVRRQQTKDNLGEVIRKALETKLPKLVKTSADKRMLFLERQHMNLCPERILDKIEKLKAAHPNLAQVDEIWFLETVFYDTGFGGSYLRFERYENGARVGSFDFQGPELRNKFESGESLTVSRYSE